MRGHKFRNWLVGLVETSVMFFLDDMIEHKVYSGVTQTDAKIDFLTPSPITDKFQDIHFFLAVLPRCSA
jgi:hypothetical protein